MKQSGEPQLVDHVMSATIPMRGRMIHGQSPNGTLYEHSQNYGVDDQVRDFRNPLDFTHENLFRLCCFPKRALPLFRGFTNPTHPRLSTRLTEEVSTLGC